MKAYVCKSCGAELLIKDDLSFTTCIYCGNNIALIDKSLDNLNIKKIIPFSIDKEKAIKRYQPIIGKNILELKKVYVPVRFCQYDFDFLIYYEYVAHSSDDGNTYRKVEELIDGYVLDDIAFSNSKISSIYLPHEISGLERLDFDPVLLKDVSIEYCELDSLDKVQKSKEKEVYDFGISTIKKEISSIYNTNYFVSDFKMENYNTLIPVYMMKTYDGKIYNMPGVVPKKILKKKFRTNIFITILFIALSVFGFFFANELMKNNTSSGKGPVVMIGILFMALICIGIFLKRKDYLNDRIYDNFHYKKYSNRKNEKSIKK